MARKKKKVEYIASIGAPFTDKEAQKIGPAIQGIESRDGKVTPESVVEDARSETSPLHRYFEWNDTKAAKKYRLSQARLIINHLQIRVVFGGEPVETKAFHSVKVEGVRRYQSHSSINEDLDLQGQVVSRAAEELASWLLRYRRYQELWPMVEFAESFLEDLELA